MPKKRKHVDILMISFCLYSFNCRSDSAILLVFIFFGPTGGRWWPKKLSGLQLVWLCWVFFAIPSRVGDRKVFLHVKTVKTVKTEPINNLAKYNVPVIVCVWRIFDCTLINMYLNYSFNNTFINISYTISHIFFFYI